LWEEDGLDDEAGEVPDDADEKVGDCERETDREEQGKKESAMSGKGENKGRTVEITPDVGKTANGEGEAPGVAEFVRGFNLEKVTVCDIGELNVRES
jgi:hypothetical protein